MNDSHHHDTPTIGGNKTRLRSLADLDGRTNSAKKARQLVADIESDLGGADHLSAGQRELITRASVLGAYLQSCEVAWLAGEHVEVASWFSAIDRQRRILECLGLERKAKDVSLSAYLATKARE